MPPPATIPAGPIPAANPFRIIEANLSYHLLGHVLSIGKSDHWFVPTVGCTFTYSNNAENIYAFQIDRTEPLYIPPPVAAHRPLPLRFLRRHPQMQHRSHTGRRRVRELITVSGYSHADQSFQTEEVYRASAA